MACIRVRLVVWGFLFLTTSHLLSGEIHRAKPLRMKVTPRVFPPGPPPPQLASETELFQQQQYTTKTAANSPDILPESSGHSQTTWLYSMFSAALVGLSGIFPLLVIPLEAGKALRKGAPAAHLKLLLSFAVGGLLGDVFLHLLPEAWAHIPPDRIHEGHMEIGLWVLTGMLSFLIIEKVFPDHEDNAESEGSEQTKITGQTSLTTTPNGYFSNGVSPSTDLRHRSTDTAGIKDKHAHQNGHSSQNGHCGQNGHSMQNGHGLQNGHGAQNGHMNGDASNGVVANGNADHGKQEDESEDHIKVSGWLNLMANVIDNFTHGLAVAGSYCISTKTGIITTIAILLHEIPHEIGDFAILLRSGFDRWKAAKAQLLTASGGMFGALAALTAESAEVAGDRTAWVLPFTSGGFIYIALVTVVPDLLKETNPWESLKQMLLLLSGIAIMAMVTLFFD